MNEKYEINTITENFNTKRIIYYILGVLEVLFSIRFILKLLGANPESGFVSFIYTVSRIFLLPFITIFRTGVTEGVETTSVFEPGTLIAMIIYALIAWGITKLIVVIRKRNT